MRPKSSGKPYTLALAFFLLLSAIAGGNFSWADVVTPEQYRARIQKSIERLKSREGKIEEDERLRLEETFPRGLKVRVKSGEDVLVDRDPFFAKTSRPRNHLVAHLEALLAQVSLEPAAKEPDWETARAALEDVYRNREFSHLKEDQTPAWQKVLQEFLEFLGNWTKDHLRFVGQIDGHWIPYLTLVAILLLCSMVVIWILRSFGPLGWRWRKSKLGAPPPTPSKHPEPDWRALRDQALKKAHDGAYRDAVRFLFISALMEGHQRGWWIYEPEATNTEHLSRMEGPSQRREAFQSLVDVYEKAWYGLGQPNRREFRHCEEWVRLMEALP